MKTGLALRVHCKSRRGIVSAISTFLAEQGCNITDSAQFDDAETGSFFMRISFQSEEGRGLDDLTEAFAPVCESFDMDAEFFDEAAKRKVVIMVSRFGHCLNDLLYRWRIGALPIDIVAVISNHMDYQKVVVNHDIPFHCIKVTKENKAEAEARIMQVVEDTGAELIVLARYMQILSDAMCRKMSGRIINIHHSFLPSFKGANPYKQAFEKGVKLIGATSHYVTSRSRRRSDHRTGHDPCHACSIARGLRVAWARCRSAGLCAGHPCPCEWKGLLEWKQDGGFPAVAGLLRLGTYGIGGKHVQET